MVRKAMKRGRSGGDSSIHLVRVDFDPHRFKRLELAILYEKLKYNNMIVEKSIHPRIDDETQI